MARKLDHDDEVAQHPLALPYRDDVTVSLVRVMSLWTSADYQRAIAADAGLPEDPNAIPALYLIAARGTQRPSALASALGVSPPVASRLAQLLATAGLIQRTPDPGDARATLLALTAGGRATARALFAAGDRLMRELLAGWPEGDREQLAALLHRFADAVEDDARGLYPQKGTP